MTEPTHIHSHEKMPASNARPLALTIRHEQAELDALWAMTAQQRIDAMWAGQMSLSQLTEWTARRPREVPLLGREWAWIEMRTPEWADANETVDNVIELPNRGDQRAAA
jgi:hypothetical protein